MYVVKNTWILIGDSDRLRCAVSWYQKSSVVNTFHLVDCSLLEHITFFDISDCVKIDVILPFMKQLSIFVYCHCKSISEHNLIRIAETCNTLTYIDGTGGKPVSYASALAVLSTLKNLGKIAVQPKSGESAHWSKLIMQFHRVTFAYCIKATLPYGGISRHAFAEISKLPEM